MVVALAAAVHAYDIYADAPLGSGIKLALFAGFLSYKARRAPAPSPLSNLPKALSFLVVCIVWPCELQQAARYLWGFDIDVPLKVAMCLLSAAVPCLERARMACLVLIVTTTVCTTSSPGSLACSS